MRVTLLGEAFRSSENLAVRLLDSALREAGHEVTRVPLSDYDELDRAAQEAVASQPALIGLSMCYQVSALRFLAVAHRLRELGYEGHLTVGGAFATLHAEEVFRDAPIDSLILFEGERPLVALAQQLELGESLDGTVPGLLLRDGEGYRETLPAPVWLDPFPVWPTRDGAFPEHLGIKSAVIIASRGCDSNCAYCCIAALATSARKEARKAGKRPRTAGCLKKRAIPDILAEMRTLRAQHDVRLFRLEDDCLLGSSPMSARGWIAAMGEGLKASGVDDIAFTVKLRPDSLDASTTRLLADLGMIHGFVGLEAMTNATLRRLARAYQTPASRAALEALEDANIPAYFNALILGPDATLETVRDDVEALAEVDVFPYEITTLVLYKDTTLFRRLSRREGAIQGNYLGWRYTFTDPRVEAIVRLLGRSESRKPGAYNVAKRLGDLGFNVALARRFYPTQDIRDIEDDYRRLVAEANRATQALMFHLIDLASARPDREAQERLAPVLAEQIRRVDGDHCARIAEAFTRLEDRVRQRYPVRPNVFMRSGLAAAAMCVQLAFAGCSPTSAPENPIPTPRTTVPERPAEPDVTSTAAAPPSAADATESPRDDAPTTPPDDATVTPPEADAETTPAPPPNPVPRGCKTPVTTEAERWLTIHAMRPCVRAAFCDVSPVVTIHIDAKGLVTGVKGEISRSERRCVQKALKGVCFPAISNQKIPLTLYGPCD